MFVQLVRGGETLGESSIHPVFPLYSLDNNIILFIKDSMLFLYFHLIVMLMYTYAYGINTLLVAVEIDPICLTRHGKVLNIRLSKFSR